MASHIFQPRKGGVYAVRVRIPADLSGRYRSSKSGRAVAYKVESLGTSDKAEARKRAREKLVESDAAFERVRSRLPLTRREIQDAALELYRSTLSRLANEAVVAPDPDEPLWLSGDRALRKEALERNDPTPVRYAIEVVQRRYQIEYLSPDDPAHGHLARALLRAEIAALEGRMRALAGESSTPPQSFLDIDPVTLQPLRLDIPATGRVKYGPLALFEAWIAAKPRPTSTTSRWRVVFTDLQSKFEGKEITEADAKAWAKGAVTADRTAHTVNNVWVNAAKAIYALAMRKDPPLVSANPFLRAKVEDVPERIETRDSLAFTLEEARTILGAALAIKPMNPFTAAQRMGAVVTILLWRPRRRDHAAARQGCRN